MASPEDTVASPEDNIASPELSARELAEYGDEELDRYLIENGRLVRVHDPENLTNSFIERLRYRLPSVHDDIVRSFPVNLNEVSARLLQACADGKLSPKRHTPPIVSPEPRIPIAWRARRYGITVEAFRAIFAGQRSSQDPSPSGSSDWDLHIMREEREAHDELVKDGGRPWYPIHLLEEINCHPERHLELLRYWQDGNPNVTEVFELQLMRWKEFRRWQERIRYSYKGRFAEHTEKTRSFLLNKHAFTAPVEFAFEEDPKQQDQLTTWIEYLAHECRICTKRSFVIRRRQPDYDAQWKKLVDSGVLLSGQTEEFLRKADSIFRQPEAEETRLTELLRLCVLPASQQDSLMKLFYSIKGRNDRIREFLKNTATYRRAKNDAEHEDTWLQWIKDQISMIVVEQEQGKVADDSPDASRGQSQGKVADDGPDASRGQSQGLKRVRADEDTEGHGNKRRKHDAEEPTAPLPQGQALKRSRDASSADHEAPPKRPKRGVTHTSAHGTSITSNRAPTGLDKASDDIAQTQPTDLPEPPTVVRHLRRSTRQPAPRSGSKPNAPGRSTNIAEPSTVHVPLRRSARIAERQRRSETKIAPSTSAGRARRGPSQVAGPPAKAARVGKGKGKKR